MESVHNQTLKISQQVIIYKCDPGSESKCKTCVAAKDRKARSRVRILALGVNCRKDIGAYGRGLSFPLLTL